MSIRSANANRVLANGNTYAERVKNSFVSDITNGFVPSNPSYFDVLINNDISTTGVQITQLGYDTSNKVEYKIVMKPSDMLNCGDIVIWKSNKWLVTSVEIFNDIYYWGVLQECNNVLKFYKNSILSQLPCIFNNGSINKTDNNFMQLPSGHYNIKIKNDGIIDKSDLNLRFILNSGVYKVVGINDSENGLINIEVEDDEFCNDDNKELGIADWGKNQSKTNENSSTGNLIVNLTPSNYSLMLGRTLELIAHAYNNNVEDLTKFYLFTVTNEDGTTNNYVTTTILGNTCKLVANKNSSCAGKIIKVHVAILGSPSIYYERLIKLVSLI